LFPAGQAHPILDYAVISIIVSHLDHRSQLSGRQQRRFDLDRVQDDSAVLLSTIGLGMFCSTLDRKTTGRGREDESKGRSEGQ
jgi:hypothetical protein